MSDQNVRKYGSEGRTAKEPFPFQIGDSPTFLVEEPDAYTVMDIEEAKHSRQVLKLFLGEQYQDVEDYLGPQHPDVLVELARDLSRHFGLFDVEQAQNRVERRRRGKAAGRH
ncbi:hypothetical protein EEB13_05540 [Rhodococcus sp. WS3]|uniref:hypothetical protein n=1 Tax=Rhodococcus sp. WS3 TaxID=2486271 RepID=UPI00114136BD|nr:hypothetical protein [Rhodococcus sp. WS3]ROZ51008.1 hypothetical protein EEB13_05540 [Rhodococcus sp. WS3]